MMNTTNTLPENNSIDLDEMRTQLNILKTKLDQQTIVTDRLIHSAMRQKMSVINKYTWFEALVMYPIICVAAWQVKIMMGLSIWSYLLLIIFTALCIASDFIINKMKAEDWESGNLMQTGIKLARMKHTRKVQVNIQLVLVVIILAVMGYDAYTANVMPHGRLLVTGISMLVGGLVGGAIGFRILTKFQHINDDLIKQIEELTSDEQPAEGK